MKILIAFMFVLKGPLGTSLGQKKISKSHGQRGGSKFALLPVPVLQGNVAKITTLHSR